ncbi:hypothetical protein F7734_15920 [Scytonema sp. UIC 10036]|uniref:hypothetical protein n=1 Tax=Scytonema sp. UIC 10036 TaxID=2304196 RepID=UPI0012DAEC82|nr:hypothetical protein [Scytonema sp. UIC 10036]MUG93820.1 hypothetical protein [Scytonema sp. UIC 10036]
MSQTKSLFKDRNYKIFKKKSLLLMNFISVIMLLISLIVSAREFLNDREIQKVPHQNSKSTKPILGEKKP